MSEIAGRNLLVTGAASGIGRLLALKAAIAGATVVLWDIDAMGLEKLLTEIQTNGGKAFSYRCDVSTRQEVYRIAEQVRADVGMVDILINNAGVVSGKPLLECTDEQIQRTMDVNITAHFWTVRAFLPGMIQANRGHIVTIASAGGIVGASRMVDYCASKFAAFGFDEALRMEIRKNRWRIKTTVVCPYYINTGMFAGVRTRFPWLLPILEEDLVAGRIMHAIQFNKKRLLMPLIVYSVWLLRLLPVVVFDWITTLLGINACMDEFRGR
ncbi:MAG TPA: short-chain dehydrogenase [Syntrophobacteraceae bacterium]|nr:short-chain dehydrogenase [Syntrophobacteraceae bacterium]